MLFPFKVTIPEEEQDINLVHKLCEELPGIMNWVLEGLKRLAVNKTFTNSPSCNAALSDYQLRTNSGLMFLHDRCEISKNETTRIKDLYTAYCLYCNEEGNTSRLLKRNFKECLDAFGATKYVRHHVEYYDVKVVKYDG